MNYIVAAIVLGLFGLIGVFVFPWVGGVVLLVALVVGVLGFALGVPAAATVAGDDDVKIPSVDAPRLPGPGDPESGVE